MIKADNGNADNERDAEGEMVKLNYDKDTNKGERALKVTYCSIQYHVNLYDLLKE